MTKHDHQYIGCEHELKFCAHCDTVYCAKCSREWFSGRPAVEKWQPYLRDPYWDRDKILTAEHNHRYP